MGYPKLTHYPDFLRRANHARVFAFVHAAARLTAFGSRTLGLTRWADTARSGPCSGRKAHHLKQALIEIGRWMFCAATIMAAAALLEADAGIGAAIFVSVIGGSTLYVAIILPRASQ